MFNIDSNKTLQFVYSFICWSCLLCILKIFIIISFKNYKKGNALFLVKFYKYFHIILTIISSGSLLISIFFLNNIEYSMLNFIIIGICIYQTITVLSCSDKTLLKYNIINAICILVSITSIVFIINSMNEIMDFFFIVCLPLQSSLSISCFFFCILLTINKNFFIMNIIKIESNLDECPICLDNLSSNVSIELLCKHKFHKSCINTHMEYKLECPMCRNKIINYIV